MSTKMGFWRWALASVAFLIATGEKSLENSIDKREINKTK